MIELATQTMSEHDARRLTERLRIAAVNYSEAKEKLMSLVQQAKDGAAHQALGYASWTSYLAEVLGDEPLRLARGERQEVVQMLSAEGMSTRAIAPIVGASPRQVAYDRGVQSCTPEPVRGMDGKTYSRPEPKPEPKREPSKELDIINDIRLYLNAIATSRQITGLSPAGKQHIIDALTNTINELRK